MISLHSDFTKIKHTGKGVLCIYDEEGTAITMENKIYPHSDFIDALTAFSEPMADVLQIDVERVHVKGIAISGSGDKACLIITGTMDTEIGSTAVNTPRISYVTDKYPWMEGLIMDSGSIDTLKRETYEYFVNKKSSQLAIDFETSDEQEEKILEIEQNETPIKKTKKGKR